MKLGEVDKPNADVVGRIPSEACDSREQTGTAQTISEWLKKQMGAGGIPAHNMKAYSSFTDGDRFVNWRSALPVVVNEQADAQRVDVKRSKSRRWFPAKRQRNVGDQHRPPQKNHVRTVVNRSSCTRCCV